MERTYEWSCVYIVYSSIFPLYLHCHTNIFIVRHKEAILSWVNVNGTQVSFACILKKGSFSFYIFSFIFFYSYWVMRRKIYSELHFIFLDNLFSFHATCIRKEYFWINHKISIEPNSFILIILIQIHAKKLFFLHSPIIYRLNHWIRFRFFFSFSQKWRRILNFILLFSIDDKIDTYLVCTRYVHPLSICSFHLFLLYKIFLTIDI